MPQAPQTVKKMLPIIYVIDTSGSMKGDRIAAVNEAMHECEAILKEKAMELPDAEIRIGAITFSSGAQWVTPGGLVSLEDFYWADQTAGGVTDLGEAINELEKKLSRTGFLVSEVGYAVPVIIFMSDGYPGDDYKKALKHANENNRWFKSAKKIAIGFGESDNDVLEEITGNVESVITVHDLETLKKLIVAISATASMIAGQSRMTNDTSNILASALETSEDISMENIDYIPNDNFGTDTINVNDPQMMNNSYNYDTNNYDNNNNYNNNYNNNNQYAPQNSPYDVTSESSSFTNPWDVDGWA